MSQRVLVGAIMLGVIAGPVTPMRPDSEGRTSSTARASGPRVEAADVTGSGRLRFRQDFGGMFGIPANNVFLVKFSCWFNL